MEFYEIVILMLAVGLPLTAIILKTISDIRKGMKDK